VGSGDFWKILCQYTDCPDYQSVLADPHDGEVQGLTGEADTGMEVRGGGGVHIGMGVVGDYRVAISIADQMNCEEV